MSDQIKENPISAATLRICAVYLKRSGRNTNESIVFWAQVISSTQSKLSKKVKEAGMLSTTIGRGKVSDQLLKDISVELEKFDVPAIKRILKNSMIGEENA